MSAILILLFVWASVPKARTGCGRAARPGPCGGCRVTGIPTAIPAAPPFFPFLAACLVPLYALPSIGLRGRPFVLCRHLHQKP